MPTRQRIVNLKLLPLLEDKHFSILSALETTNISFPKGFSGYQYNKVIKTPPIVEWMMVVDTMPIWGFELSTTLLVCHDSNHYTKAMVHSFQAIYHTTPNIITNQLLHCLDIVSMVSKLANYFNVDVMLFSYSMDIFSMWHYNNEYFGSLIPKSTSVPIEYILDSGQVPII